MNIPNNKSIVEAIRKRHNLSDSTPVRIKAAGASIEAEAGETWKFRAVINTDALDRDYEVVLPEGIETAEYEKNPTILYQHDYAMPVGQTLALAKSATRITAKAQFAFRPDNFVGEFYPDLIRAMVQQGVIRTTSIGFIPLETRLPTRADDQRWPGVERIITRSKLLEWSLVTIPSNPTALITEAAAKGLDVRALFGEDDDDPQEQEVINREVELSPVVKHVHHMLQPVERLPALSIDKQIEKTLRRAISKARGRVWSED